MTDGTVYNQQLARLMRDSRTKGNATMEKISQKIYNRLYKSTEEGADEIVAGVTEKTVKRHLKYIKKSIKKRIAKYGPLDFSTAYPGIIEKLQIDDFKTLKEIPANDASEAYLDELVKNHLIEQTYYELGERYIRQRLMARLGISDENDIKLLEIVDFIMENLETNGLERLKQFKEKAKFKTFLSFIAGNLLMDFWRKKYQKDKNVNRFETDFLETFDPPADDPQDVLIKEETDDWYGKAAAILPPILKRMDFKERLAIKMKHEQKMKLSVIARTLDLSRHKAGRFIDQIEMELIREIEKLMKKGGKNGTSGQ